MAQAIELGQDFTVAFNRTWGDKRKITIDAYVFVDGDTVHLLKRSVCLQSSYTDEQTTERARLNAMNPLIDGDTVEFNGKAYTVKINGDYSDCGFLIPA